MGSPDAYRYFAPLGLKKLHGDGGRRIRRLAQGAALRCVEPE
jgi:hypothetical protein